MSLRLEDVRGRLQGRPHVVHAGGPATQRAAVAAILRERAGEAEVLFIRRAEKSGDPWSGQMAFPGGRKDLVDADLTATVLRETREEIGVDLGAHGELLGRLDDLQAVAKFRSLDLVIAPFVYALAREVEGRTSDEVAELHWAPLAPLLAGEVATTWVYHHAGERYDLPAYRVADRVVWGLTYRMLQLLFDRLRAGP